MAESHPTAENVSQPEFAQRANCGLKLTTTDVAPVSFEVAERLPMGTRAMRNAMRITINPRRSNLQSLSGPPVMGPTMPQGGNSIGYLAA